MSDEQTPEVPEEPAPRLAKQGLQAQLRNGSRVAGILTGTGVVWEFEREGRRTDVPLSREAMEAIIVIWMRLTLGAVAGGPEDLTDYTP